MGNIVQPAPVLLLLGAFSRYETALAKARERAEERFGPVALASTAFAFRETAYYERTMGPELMKQFWAFERLIDPGELPAIKRLTNAWEEEYALAAGRPEERPLNLDPGYITLAKLVLASTKDHAHRIYLADGIFAEVTLYYRDGGWRHRDWTFPDYRRADYHEFFTRCRQYLNTQLRQR